MINFNDRNLSIFNTEVKTNTHKNEIMENRISIIPVTIIKIQTHLIFAYKLLK